MLIFVTKDSNSLFHSELIQKYDKK